MASGSSKVRRARRWISYFTAAGTRPDRSSSRSYPREPYWLLRQIRGLDDRELPLVRVRMTRDLARHRADRERRQDHRKDDEDHVLPAIPPVPFFDFVQVAHGPSSCVFDTENAHRKITKTGGGRHGFARKPACEIAFCRREMCRRVPARPTSIIVPRSCVACCEIDPAADRSVYTC